MAFNYEDEDRRERIVRECLSPEFDEYVAIAKGKYYYERVEDNPEATALYVETNNMVDQTVQASIDSIPSRLIFFPHESLTHTDGGVFLVATLFMFCVRCEILWYLKRLLPPHLKRKMKSIGHFIRDEQVIDKEFVKAVEKLVNAETAGLFQLKHLNKIYDFTLGAKRVRIVRVRNGQVQCREVAKEYEAISELDDL